MELILLTDKQLEYIVTIATEANITRAAQKLYIGQSALSQTLAHVEAELGIKIFLRSTGALIPTPSGELFLQSARDILQIKRNLLAQYREQKQPKFGSIHIGMSQSRSWLFTPIILPKFIQQYPEVNIVFTEGNETELNKLLVNGKIDLVFTINPHTDSRFCYHNLFDEQIVLSLAKQHPLCLSGALSEPLDLSLLEGVSFFLLQKGNDLRRLADLIFSDAQIYPRILLESHSMDICFQMSATGLGAAVIPDTLYYCHRDRDQVNIFHIGKQYSRKMAIVYRKNMYLSFIAKEFIRISEESLRQVYQPLKQ